MSINLFELASREKFRYPYKGQISTEDLWDLSAEKLDLVFKALSNQKKTTMEESLLGQPTREEQILEAKLNIVRYIFATKQEELEQRRQKAANAEKRRRIMEIIASKEDDALASQSVEDLKKMLDELE